MLHQPTENSAPLTVEMGETDSAQLSSLFQRLKTALNAPDIWAASVEEAFISLAAEMSGAEEPK